MTEKILVPDHVAAEVEAKAKKETEKESETDTAFVSPEERVLDPTLMSKSLVERMPNPSGWRMLILPYKGRGVSKGGITLVKDTVDREALASVVAYVVKMGPLCYKDKDKFPSGPWCKEGQFVIYGRYAGSRFKIDGREVRILNDDEILAKIMDPEDVLHY